MVNTKSSIADMNFIEWIGLLPVQEGWSEYHLHVASNNEQSKLQQAFSVLNKSNSKYTLNWNILICNIQFQIQERKAVIIQDWNSKRNLIIKELSHRFWIILAIHKITSRDTNKP